MTQDEIDRREWENPRNWSGWLGLYSSEDDSRFWVPKRPGRFSRGVTPNMAKPSSRIFFWGMTIVPIALLLTSIIVVYARTVPRAHIPALGEGWEATGRKETGRPRGPETRRLLDS
ncbi:MAG: hypothetical protein ABS36_18995 [Acidobacteria bacterium SCN 69-37]|nr:MAG: hypothetical protein ABS36_18995 [Acidobacteria bacterium SCN 69-37]